jgi:hypothetical protein
MKSTILFVCLFSYAGLVSGQSQEIQSIIDVTKKAIFSAAAELKKKGNLPNLSKVEITLEVATETTADGGIKLYVVSAETSIGKTNTQTVTIELEPDWNAPIDISAQNLGKQLKDLILEASKGIANANTGAVALKAKRVELEIGIEIKKTGGLDGGFDIGVVKVSAGGSVSKSNSSSVKLIFGS